MSSSKSGRWARADAWLSRQGDGFWALVLLGLGVLIYLPRLGAYPLWDPWEPHYTQVAWEMGERLTWNNPWYRGVDNWWSKPILMLWMLRASLGLFWDHVADFVNNQWAARLPFALSAIAGGVLHFDWVRRLYGRKAGVLAGIILMTAPQYLLVGRQVMADMPFVAAYAAAMGYLAVGLFAQRPVFASDTLASPGDEGRSRRQLALLIFWLALGLALILTGWAPVITALCVLIIYGAATFRWTDYRELVGAKVGPAYLLIRGGMAVGIILAGAGLVVAGSKLWPQHAHRVRWVIVDVVALALPLGVFHDFPLCRHVWRVLGRCRLTLGAPMVAGTLGISTLMVSLSTGEFVVGVGLADRMVGPIWRVLTNPIAWTLLPWLAFVADRTGVHSFRRWLAGNWPFAAFWVLQALAVLSKGFVAPALAVMILAAYWASTFRWRDYSELMANRPWLRYLLIRGGLALAIAAAAFTIAYFLPGMQREQRALYQFLIGMAAASLIGLGLFHDLPPARHALRLLVRIRAGWGLLLFLALAAPWFVYMSVEHGWPYWNEWIFYHHLGRAAGTIDKPSGTFDFFVKQISFAVFPWTAFALGAVWKFLGQSSPTRSIANRRNLYILLGVAIPYLFFSLSGTKFAHYIMPVVPLLSVMLAVTLVWLGREAIERVALAEGSPALGPPVPAYAGASEPWWKTPGARGDMLVFAAVALIVFGILAHDLVLDFRHYLRLFVYYYNRQTPFEYQPFVILQVFYFPLGTVIGLLVFGRYVSRWHLVGFSTGAVLLACYLGWVTMPAMKMTYSFEVFHRAYHELAKPGEPIGQYNDWQQPVRSVIFLFQNRCVHLRTDKQATAFLKRSGRKFILVDRQRLADLRRVAKEANTSLYVVFDDHPYGRMVSDQPNPQDTRKAAKHILTEVPPGITRIDASFEDKIRLLGWQVDPPQVKPGRSTRVSMYYKCEQTMRRDWQIFIHGDGPRGGSHRIHLDHFPLDGLYPTTEWQEGEIIRDTFTVNVPADYPFDYFYLWTGWYIGNQRLKLANNPPNDGQHRVRGPRVRVMRD